jgi:hypothetical protein
VAQDGQPDAAEEGGDEPEQGGIFDRGRKGEGHGISIGSKKR